VNAYHDAVRLSLVRFDNGLSNYLEVIDAQIQAFPAESAAVTYDLERKVTLVNLYQALGGGWNLTDAQWTSTSATPSATSPPTP
jgi:multidrug efflux system outer membrane protein